MNNLIGYHRAPTGGELYAFPFNQALADWETYKVQMVETPAGSTNYQALFDTDIDTLWRIFEGADAPADLTEAENAILDFGRSCGSVPAKIQYLGKTSRNVGDNVPVQFALSEANLSLTGTLGDGTPLAGAISFVQTEGDLHWYEIAHDDADRPADDGVIGYVITDGTLQWSLSLIVLTGGSGGGGGGTGSQTVTVRTEDSSGNAIQNVRVQVVGTLIEQVTDTMGQCTLKLDPGDYTLRLVAPTDWEDPDDVDITVVASVDPTVTVVLEKVPGSTNPMMTDVIAIVELNGVPVEGAIVTANLTAPNQSVRSQTAVPSTRRDEAVTNANGRAILTLYNESAFSQGEGKYSISAKHCGRTIWSFNTTIPAGTTIYLPEL